MKIICTKCKGEGIIPDLMERVFTIGISWVLDKLDPKTAREHWDTCPKCKGKGYMKL